MTALYRVLMRNRSVFSLVILLIALSFPGVSSWAQVSDDIYTIEGVEVDITASNAVEAREKAFVQAQSDAYQILAERILTESELASFQIPPVETISTLVQDFEVTDEKLSSVRYKGTYTIRFRKGAMRQEIVQQGHGYSDIPRSPVLVLPFYQFGTRTILWEPNNPWMAAWTRSRHNGGLVPVAVPIGDVLDVSQIRDDQALTYDRNLLRRMVIRYRADEAVILMAVPQHLQGDKKRVEISIYATSGGGPEYVNAVIVEADNDAQLYDEAVTRVKQVLSQNWKVKTAVQPETQLSKIKAKVRFQNVQEWVETKRALDSVSAIEKLRVAGLKPKEAQLEFHYTGDEDRLRLALEQSGISLSLPIGEYNAPVWRNAGQAYQAPPVYELSLEKFKRF